MTAPSSFVPLTLRPDEVHVWIVEPERINDPHLLQAYGALLDAGEREKQRRFRFERHQRQYLVSHALVRLTLSRYAPVAPEAWAFTPNEYGRPEAVGEWGRRLRFNLSHTDGMALVAVGLESDLGADVEDSERPGQTVEIADHFFARSEVQALRALPAEHQRERFFEYWTLKEAYIKARGLGLSISLQDFWFFLDEEPVRIAFAPALNDDPARWRFAQQFLMSNFLLAVAVAGADPAALIVERCRP